MLSNIRTLSEEVVHLIAAGEVIDSLAAVVRELVENALDAGATRLTISIWPEQWRVRVADNGSGMNYADLEQAALPHSTSKIRNHRDLGQINSLGFRGEALHSLAQLAQLEICSRSPNANEGWHFRYSHQGNPDHIETIAIAPGTIVTASHLFTTLLARREGLPALTQQLRAVQTTIQQLALCHPQVTWQVEQNGREWFSIWSGQSAKQILPQLLRDVQPTDLLELTLEGSTHSDDPNSLKLYVLLGLPDRCHRYRPDWVRVAVNGRVVKSPELEQTILSAFRRTLPRDRYPVCFLHLHIAPRHVDWNRHPAKSEIYLHDMLLVQSKVLDAIAQALPLSPATLPDTAYSERIGNVLKAAEAKGVYQNSRSIEPSDPTLASLDLSDPLPTDHSSPLAPLKAIAQVHQMYILAEHPSGIWLIEQHIAHERVLYEQLRDRWQLVQLDPPVTLGYLAPAQIEQLQRIGLEVEVFGDQLWAIRTAPDSLAQREDCADALLELSAGGDLEAALVAIACRTAIRNGTPLSLPQMQTLLDQWQQTRQPRTCPHGRPICLTLDESSLSRFFRRHWVIGKSHGI